MNTCTQSCQTVVLCQNTTKALTPWLDVPLKLIIEPPFIFLKASHVHSSVLGAQGDLNCKQKLLVLSGEKMDTHEK